MNILNRYLGNLGHSFFSLGWMAVGLLPLTQVLGRAVFNIAGSLFLAWGLASLLTRAPRLPRSTLLLYGLLITSFAASSLAAENVAAALSRWNTFLLYSLVAFPVAAAIRTAANLRRLIDAFAVGGVLTVTAVYIALAVQHGDGGFVPEKLMREDNLPLLLPFILCALHQRCRRQHFVPLAFVALVTVAAYIVLSNGRAALLGLIVGLSVYALLALGARWRTVAITVALILAAAVAVRGEHLYRRHVTVDQDMLTTLNRTSSFRLELWTNAIRNPPDNILIGAGMGNTPKFLLRVNAATSANLRHLHNFLLDTWHETGLLGLAALVAWLAHLGRRALLSWRQSSTALRPYLATLLAASAAIISSALFSFSYGSKQFACYLFVFLLAATAAAEMTTADSPTKGRSQGL